MGNKNTIPNKELSDGKKTTYNFFENKNHIHSQSNDNFINEEKKEKDKPQFLNIFISNQKNNNNNNTQKNYQLDGNKYMNCAQATTAAAYSSSIFSVNILFKIIDKFFILLFLSITTNRLFFMKDQRCD